MRTRTLLTTPPGGEPAPIVSDRWDLRAGDGQERYAPGFDLPAEPLPPSRLTRPTLLVSCTVLIVALGLLGTRLVTSGTQDPSVPETDQAPTSPAATGVPAPPAPTGPPSPG